MSRSRPFVKINIGVDGIIVTLSKEIVMDDGVQFSKTVYTLKAIERQLISDSQQENPNTLELKDDRPKSPTPPNNFEELFANMDGFNNDNHT